MANIIALCTHDQLSVALLDAASMISGVPEGVRAFPLLAGKDPMDYRADVESFLDEHPQDDCLILVDLFGGTPANMCASLSVRDGVEVVAGVNLPMLIEVATRKDQMTISDLRKLAIEGGTSSVIDVKQRFMQVFKSN